MSVSAHYARLVSLLNRRGASSMIDHLDKGKRVEKLEREQTLKS